MKIHLSLCCPLMALLAIASALQCDYRNYEYVCLVESSCLVDSPLTPGELTILHPGMALKDQPCSWIVKLKNINNLMWIIDIEFSGIEWTREDVFWLSINDSSIYICAGSVEDTYFKGHQIYSDIYITASNPVRISGRCAYEVQSMIENIPMSEVFRAAGREGSGKLYMLHESKKIQNQLMQYTDSMDDLANKVILTRGCNESSVNIISGTVERGEILKVTPRLIGRDPEINCNEKRADVLQIKLNDTWEQVGSVFCHGQVWAYHPLNDTKKMNPIYLGDQTFGLKCIRDYCKFCGTIMAETCAQCEKIKEPYNNCRPECKDNLWYFDGKVIQSNLTCKPHKLNEDNGVWTGVSNGVEMPFEMGSCYKGPYPLPERKQEEAKPSSSRAPALWSIIACIIASWL